MNTTSHIAEELRRVLTHPRHGVVGLVDDLLTVCQKHHLQLDWQNNRCRVRFTGGAWEELTDLPIRKSIFRAILACIATLCNEKTPNAVSPYGGQYEWLTGENPPTVFRVLFANTASEQKLELTARTEEATAPAQMAAPLSPHQLRSSLGK
jgi:hypothetical protein